MLWWLLQDATGRREVDQVREDARLRRIAQELAKEEETQRQWRVARGQVGDPLLYHDNAARVVPGLPCCPGAKVHAHSMRGTRHGANRWMAVEVAR